MSQEVIHHQLFMSIKELIEQSKQQVAISVNTTMSMLYWQIGKQINEEIKLHNRAEIYGKQIVATLWRQLLLPSQKYYKKNSIALSNWHNKN